MAEEFGEKRICSDEGLDRRTFIAIDLKSLYASAECVERGLDPLKTNLVVADPTVKSRSP